MKAKCQLEHNLIMAAWLESQFMQKYASMHMPPILTLQPLKFVGRGILLGMCQTYQILKYHHFHIQAIAGIHEFKGRWTIFFNFISNLLVDFHLHKINYLFHNL